MNELDKRTRAHLDLTARSLSDPFHLTYEDYEDAAHNIQEIIYAAQKYFHITNEDLKPKLLELRNFAAHSGVDIQLPKEFDELASLGVHFRKIDHQPEAQPKTSVDERYWEGVQRTLDTGRKER